MNFPADLKYTKDDEWIKIEGDKALRASGELTEGEAGTLVLKDPAKLSWEETFTRVECD